jgi:hypothetical protein
MQVIKVVIDLEKFIERFYQKPIVQHEGNGPETTKDGDGNHN